MAHCLDHPSKSTFAKVQVYYEQKIPGFRPKLESCAKPVQGATFKSTTRFTFSFLENVEHCGGKPEQADTGT